MRNELGDEARIDKDAQKVKNAVADDEGEDRGPFGALAPELNDLRDVLVESAEPCEERGRERTLYAVSLRSRVSAKLPLRKVGRRKDVREENRINDAGRSPEQALVSLFPSSSSAAARVRCSCTHRIRAREQPTLPGGRRFPIHVVTLKIIRVASSETMETQTAMMLRLFPQSAQLRKHRMVPKEMVLMTREIPSKPRSADPVKERSSERVRTTAVEMRSQVLILTFPLTEEMIMEAALMRRGERGRGGE